MGMGGIGASPYSKGTNRITMTVGRMARAAGGVGPVDGAFTDPSPFGDAAKIYIADMTDADTNFGFCDSEVGNVKGQSAIVNFCRSTKVFWSWRGSNFYWSATSKNRTQWRNKCSWRKTGNSTPYYFVGWECGL